jgi:hypothetical protein
MQARARHKVAPAKNYSNHHFGARTTARRLENWATKFIVRVCVVSRQVANETLERSHGRGTPPTDSRIFVRAYPYRRRSSVTLVVILLVAAFLLAAKVAVFALVDHEAGEALLLSLARNQRWIAPRVIVVGDSLAACCPFGKLSRRPLGVLTLAKGGATLKEIGEQILQARGIAARYLVIDGGLNDILFHDAPPEQIEHDFRALLRRLDDGARAIFTLMPHVADPAYSERVEAANRRMAALCAERGVAVVDLNPELSAGGVRRPEMTDDGLHFSPRANEAWIAAVKRAMT